MTTNYSPVLDLTATVHGDGITVFVTVSDSYIHVGRHAELLIEMMNAAEKGVARVWYGNIENAEPVPIREAVLDILQMDPDAIGEGDWGEWPEENRMEQRIKQIKERLEADTNTFFTMTNADTVIEFYAPKNPLVTLFFDAVCDVFVIRCRPCDDTSCGIDYETASETQAFDVFKYVYTIMETQRANILRMFAL